MNYPYHPDIESTANDNHWHLGNTNRRFEKDGYEIYFYKGGGGFELTIRDPDSMERESVINFPVYDNRSPATIACLCYLLENAESVVAECT